MYRRCNVELNFTVPKLKTNNSMTKKNKNQFFVNTKFPKEALWKFQVPEGSTRDEKKKKNAKKKKKIRQQKQNTRCTKKRQTIL